MSQEMMPPESQANPKQSWINIWIAALTRPSVETYTQFSDDPDATSQRAYKWVFLAAGLSALISSLLGAALSGGPGSNGGAGFSVLTLICIIPFSGLFAVLGLAIGAGITQVIASALGGEGNYSRLVYSFAAYIAPLSIISSVVATIPFVQLLGIPLGIYGIVLNVTAVKAVNNFSWGRAIGSSLLIFGLLLVIVAIFTIAGLALLGPSINNVFQDIIGNLPAQ
jgi:hypothetical protein